jgi:pimeloyl-ACP methyl ester carboxylesterase
MGLDFALSRDGVRLALHRLGESGRAPVVLVPGAYSSHTFWLGTRGTGFARELAREGFEAWVLDPRGHGESARPGQLDRWSFRDWISNDIPAVLHAATASGLHAAVIGHSAGGAALAGALAAFPELQDRLSGIVLLGVPGPVLRPARRLGAWLCIQISRAFGRFPARLLRFGSEDELARVMIEWMGWNLEGTWPWPGGIDLIDRLSEVVLPVLALTGEGDRLFAPAPACRALLEAIGSSARTFLECGKSTGFSKNFGHSGLVVDRAARSEVWPVIIRWLRDVAAAR